MKLSSGRPIFRSLIILTLMLVLSLIPASASAAGPTLLTDLSDYEPGDTVTFRGSGFSWGEVVNLQAVGSTNGSQINSQATADIFGNISGSFNLPLMFEYTYALTASGASSGSAAITFYDSPKNIDFVSPVTILNANQSQSYTVIATTSAGIPFPGLPVGWFVSQGGGIWSVTCNSTDGSGIATSTFTAGSIAGNFQLQAKGFGEPGCKTSVQGAVANLSITILAPDTTPPVIAIATDPSDTVAGNGWYNIATSGTDGVKVNVSASDPSGVSNITCIDNGTTQVLNVNANSGAFVLGNGTHSVSCSATDGKNNSGVGAGSTAMPVAYHIDQSAPTISAGISPAAAITGWYNSATGAPTISFSCADTGGSGLASGCPVAVTLGNGSGQSVSGGPVFDDAGNPSGIATITGIKVDLVAPTISATINPASPASTGWYNISTGAPTVSFTCADPGGSGVASCTTPVLLGEGANQSVFGTAVDVAGNSATATKSGINVDLNAPSVTASIAPTAAVTGWFNISTGAPTVSFTCNDTGSSGLAANACPAAVILGEGANQSVSRTVTDIAGNISAPASVAGINVDLTNPVLNINGAVDGAYSVCVKPSKPTFAPTDSLSGIATQSDNWTVPSNASGVGTYTYTATATDKAGNTISQTRTYTVTYGSAFGGYLQPINMDGSSRFKLGSTVPVKFQLMCGTTPIANATAWLYVAQGDSVADPGVDEAISTAASTTGNLFRYDSTAQQYIFNLSTKLGYTNPDGTTISAFSQGTWTLKIKLDDGTWRSVNIQLPK